MSRPKAPESITQREHTTDTTGGSDGDSSRNDSRRPTLGHQMDFSSDDERPQQSQEADSGINGFAGSLPLSSNDQPRSNNSIRISRDEMNLAEFPLTVLSKRADPNLKTLEFTDTVKGKNGEVVNRAWIITGADKFGLPTSSDDEVLLGLLKLTADDGVRGRKVHFTRYELLKILRWTTEGRSYSRLQNALDRLSGVRIKATNAFYDNETKLHSTRNFGIIDEYEINDGRDTRPSFFTWSEVLFKSFQVGFIKKLDLDFYLDLRSAVSKRLYRYLDKHFWYRARLQVNLFTLAHEKIGISRNYVYASSLRQQLEPALEELVERGMLAEYQFLGKGQSTEVVMVSSQGARKGHVGLHENRPEIRNGEITFGSKTVSEDSGDVEKLVRQILERGLAEKPVRRLLADVDASTLERIEKILRYFDTLVAANSPLVSKNPCGFLFRAIQNPAQFVLPEERGTRVPAGTTPTAPRSQSTSSRLFTREDSGERLSSRAFSKPTSTRPESTRRTEAEYLTTRLSTLNTLRERTSSEDLTSLRGDVERALSKLRAHISPQRFQEAVTHGVEQRLLERNGFPDFEKWSRQG